MGYQTRIDKALQQAKTEMFSRQNGARDNVPKILILLTDGSQTGRGSIDPVIPAEELRKTGVFIVVIAIGSQTDMKECKSIAGNNGIYHFVSSFDELISENFIKYVAFSICPGKTVGLFSFHLIIWASWIYHNLFCSFSSTKNNSYAIILFTENGFLHFLICFYLQGVGRNCFSRTIEAVSLIVFIFIIYHSNWNSLFSL